MPQTQDHIDALFEDHAPASGSTAAPLAILKRVYGYSEFRGRQAEVVTQIMAGGDAVVLFPTGAGKSLCFQIPALCRDGVGIVVSPLIALMRDQVEALKQAGVNAATLNSSVSSEDAAKTFRDQIGRASCRERVCQYV